MKTCTTRKISVCEDGWTSFSIGDKISCLKNVGLVHLNDAASHCQSLNADQILPRSRQESDDLVLALRSLDLASEDGKTLVSIGIYKSKEGEWYDSADQLISYFDWLPGEPDNRWNSTKKEFGGNQNYAGFLVDGVNDTSKWADYNRTDELNVVCAKTVGHGKNNSLLSID